MASLKAYCSYLGIPIYMRNYLGRDKQTEDKQRVPSASCICGRQPFFLARRSPAYVQPSRWVDPTQHTYTHIHTHPTACDGEPSRVTLPLWQKRWSAEGEIIQCVTGHRCCWHVDVPLACLGRCSTCTISTPEDGSNAYTKGLPWRSNSSPRTSTTFFPPLSLPVAPRRSPRDPRELGKGVRFQSFPFWFFV
ncbi:hypothetical protein LZ32DRAFT_6624 [Colletotrichum eremochloae]|nr:hypothetical protein LZ32DRAFT_6624 [Colletotrichum eremochloae]